MDHSEGGSSGYWWLALKWTNLLPACPGCNQALKQHIVTADMTVEQVEAMQATPPKLLAGKGIQFPVGGQRLAPEEDDHLAEQPLLIDPTRTDPAPELRWRDDVDWSVVEPSIQDHGESLLGDETIRCVALNRVGVVQPRTVLLNNLRAARVSIMQDLEAEATDDPNTVSVHLRYAKRRMADMERACDPGQPFSGMARAFVDAFERELEAWILAWKLPA